MKCGEGINSHKESEHAIGLPNILMSSKIEDVWLWDLDSFQEESEEETNIMEEPQIDIK